jgi:hypothetical protein
MAHELPCSTRKCKRERRSISVFVALIAAVTGLFLLGSNVLLVTKGRVTIGEVIDIRETERGSGSIYHIAFSYTDQNGCSHVVSSRMGTNIVTTRIGDRVRVIHSLESPKRAKLYSPVRLWVIPTLFLISAGVITTKMSHLLRRKLGTGDS